MYTIYRAIVTMHHVPCTMYHGHLELICRCQPYKLWVVYTICCAVDQPNQTKRHPITPHHTRSLSSHHPQDSPSLVTRLLGYPLPCPWSPSSLVTHLQPRPSAHAPPCPCSPYSPTCLPWSPAFLLTHLPPLVTRVPVHPPAPPGHPPACSLTPPPW